jgi:thymidylate synthase ThyX
MKKIALFLFASILLGACQNLKKEAAPVEPEDTDTVIVDADQYLLMETSEGNLALKLYRETPLHRHNFVKLARKGYYDNQQFFRIQNNFTVQAGDPKSKGATRETPLGENDFDYTIPDELNTCPEALDIYNTTMCIINSNRKRIRELLEERGIDSDRAVEIANFLLPRATNLTLTIGFTPEALIQFMWKRLCTRAQPEAQKLAHLMKDAVKRVHEDFSKELKPQCQHLLWCPEKKRCCGAAPTKEQLREELARLRGLEK